MLTNANIPLIRFHDGIRPSPLSIIVSGIPRRAKVMFVHVRPDVTPEIGAGFLIEAKMNTSVDTSVADIVGNLIEPRVMEDQPR